MATSGDTAFTLTARDHVQAALEDAKIIPLGDDPEAAELAACIRRFNGMLKSWQTKGVSWKQETISQIIAADTANTTIPAYVRAVNGARYVDSTVNERAMSRFERDDYYLLPNKTAAGISTIYYTERGPTSVDIYVWPVPTVEATLKLDIDRKMDTITSGSETVDIPEEWTETVYMNLAIRVAEIFGAQLSPIYIATAKDLEVQLFDAYRPASYFMGAA